MAKATYYQLFIGPNHPGVPGNFSLHLKLQGDTIIEAKGDPGYLHRAFEKGMEHRLYLQNLAIIPRLCVVEPDINEAAYAMAVEKLYSVEIPERAKFLRTLVLELARFASYLFWLGGFYASLGNYTLMQWTVADRDYIIDLFADLTGARIYHMYIWPGGVRRDVPSGFFDKLNDLISYFKKRLIDYDNLIFKNPIFFKRTKGIAKITQEEALKYGASGPVLKAVGIAKDVRKDTPYAAYSYLDFDIYTASDGDSFSRAIVIRKEMEISLSLIEQVIRNIPDGKVYEQMPTPFKWNISPGMTYAKVESARGEYGYFMASDGTSKPYRVSVRGPSMSHLFPLVEKILVGSRLADAAHILHSFNICPPEIDK